MICSANTSGKFESLKKFIGKVIITIGGGKDKIFIVEEKDKQSSEVFSVQSNTKYLEFRPGMSHGFSQNLEDISQQNKTLESNKDINKKMSMNKEDGELDDDDMNDNDNEISEGEEKEEEEKNSDIEDEQKLTKEKEMYLKELSESKASKFGTNSNPYENDYEKVTNSKFGTTNNFVNSQGFKEQISQITKGKHHLLKLTSEGRVYGSGESYFGVVGLGGAASSTKSVALPNLKNIQCKQISCGLYHSLALSNEGDVYTWGLGFEGQLGITGKYKVASSPRYLKFFFKKPVKFVTCGHNYSLAITKNVLV